MKRYKPRLRRGVILTVGFAFDVNAGMKPDAPLWMQRLGLTWVYRLGSEPRRLASRYLRYNSLFLFYLLRDGLRGRAWGKAVEPRNTRNTRKEAERISPGFPGSVGNCSSAAVRGGVGTRRRGISFVSFVPLSRKICAACANLGPSHIGYLLLAICYPRFRRSSLCISWSLPLSTHTIPPRNANTSSGL